jgi:radical SAM superfamily enzyme YgiQ (UPF0313 family)
MRVLLISANREEINMRTWPLGPACVAAATKRAGHEVLLLDLMGTTDPAAEVRREIHALRPDVIGISVRNIDNQDMSDTRVFLDEVRAIVAACKSTTDVPVVLGGAGYSMYPESLLRYLGADLGIVGEGEKAFPALLERLEGGGDLRGIPGVHIAGEADCEPRRFTRDLDDLPLPDASLIRDDLPQREDFWFPVQTRRGCPMDCSYCSTASIEGCILRKRSAEIVTAWMTEWVERGVRRFYFVDNTFNLPPSYARKLCGLLKATGLPLAWRCIVYPHRLAEDLAGSMAAAGCKEVSLGFESGSELVLHGMGKKFSPPDVRRVSETLGRYGIRRMGFLMLGGPGETEETALKSLEFAESLNIEAMKVTVGIRIYPNTRLATRAVAEGIIDPNDDLLAPRFYVAPGMADRLREMVAHRLAERPNWMK